MDAIILCGGKSSRMGRDKASLAFQGETFLERVAGNLSRDYPVLLAIGDHPPYPGLRWPQIPDRDLGQGPLAGMRAAMEYSSEEAFFVVTCDMPLVSGALAKYLEGHMDNGLDAAIPVGSGGRRHPLGGIYRRSSYPAISAALAAGERKVGAVLEKLRVKYVEVDRALGRQLININTPEDYQHLLMFYYTAQGIPVLSIAAYSGTGKTTFLERLIPELKAQGLRLAVVKHDAHDFEIDRENKDSWRMTRAGADVTGILSGTKAALMENRPVDTRQFLDSIREVDLILTEGYKRECWPKLMLHRSATGKPLPLEPSACLAVISDVPVPGAVRQFGIGDTAGVARFILDTMGWTI